MSKISETVTSVVSLLGGPKLNPEDIDWASDLPLGRRLLEWLVSQVQTANDGADDSEPLKAALHAISLEEDELKMLRATRKATATAEPHVTSEYIPPSRLRAKEEHMGAEAALLETETEVLKARLQQTRIASKSLSQTIKSIASEIENTERDILVTENRLSELSLKADAAILTSMRSGLGLLNEVAPNADPTEDGASHAGLLSSASSTSSAISQRFDSQLRAIDAAASRLPTPSKLHAECARLDTMLNAPRASGGSLVDTAANATLNREVLRLCEALEDPDTGDDALAAVLSHSLERPERSSAIDVTAELQRAWVLDQAAILEAREAALDEAIAAFSDTLLPPLTALHDDLAATNSHVRETQVLLCALGGELQDIVDDSRAAQQARGAAGLPDGAEDAKLQVGLTSLLKQLKDLRPGDAPPLVLLTDEDILDELRSVYERDAASRRQEETWIADLLPTLHTLEAVHAPLLNVAYAYSPMNSSPPFALATDVQSVQTDAKTRADDLGDAIARLQEEVKILDSDRSKRRLDHFVAKWDK